MIKRNIKKSILITGGAGFIGSCVAQKLLRDGHTIIIADNLSTGKRRNIPAGSDFIKIDLTQSDEFKKVPHADIGVVIHFAGQSSGELSFIDPVYDLRSHVMSTFYLLRWCKEKRINRFLYSSSMAVYGDPEYFPVDERHPLNPKTYYAAAKIAAEAYIRFFGSQGINATIFRLFSVYGPGQDLANKDQGMLSIFLSYILENKPIIVKGAKERFRDFVYISDVVNAFVLSLENPKTFGKTYNLASGKKTTVFQLINRLQAACGCKSYPVVYSQPTPGDQFGMVGCSNRIKSDVGWKANVGLADGLRKMIRWGKNL